jgi:hypothetical protein
MPPIFDGGIDVSGLGVKTATAVWNFFNLPLAPKNVNSAWVIPQPPLPRVPFLVTSSTVPQSSQIFALAFRKNDHNCFCRSGVRNRKLESNQNEMCQDTSLRWLRHAGRQQRWPWQWLR